MIETKYPAGWSTSIEGVLLSPRCLEERMVRRRKFIFKSRHEVPRDTYVRSSVVPSGFYLSYEADARQLIHS